MLKPYLQIALNKPQLTKDEAEAAMNIILEEADPYQIAAFLAILKYRGETAEEITGILAAAERRGISVHLPYPVLDIAGTGGDFANTVNISTGSAILAAACGIPVAKHGNRSVSSRSGSADVLEALGIKIEIPPEEISRCLQETNIAFMFAPYYHPYLRKLVPIRKGLKFPNFFNFLGLLLNPAKAEYSLIGVASKSTLELLAKVIVQLTNKKRTLVFHGSGLDELTSLGPITAYDIHNGHMHRLEIDPISLGFSPCSLQELQGGDAVTNASMLKDVFAGQQGAIADALIFNAGAALWIFNQASSLIEGIFLARKVLKSGKALDVLEKWKNFSNRPLAEPELCKRSDKQKEDLNNEIN